MSKPPKKPHQSEQLLFSEAVKDIKPLTQDKIITSTEKKRFFVHRGERKLVDNHGDQESIIDNLSDDFDPFENDFERNDLNYHHHSISKRQLTSLKKGQPRSELILDLHGLNRQQARIELLEFFHHCHQRDFRHVSIMPGQGMGILRKSLNNWLRQIPEVLAFAESPQRSGGKGNIRVLLSSNSLS
jgi:DNA-nicking Smr family endonuclease